MCDVYYLLATVTLGLTSLATGLASLAITTSSLHSSSSSVGHFILETQIFVAGRVKVKYRGI